MSYKVTLSRAILLCLLTTNLFVFQNCSEGFKVADQAGVLELSSSALSINPVVTLSASPDLVNTNTYTLPFNVTLATVEGVSLSSVTCQLDSGVPQDCSARTITFSNLPEGDHTIRVVAVTNQGQRAEMTKSFRKDGLPPVITVSAQPSLVTNQTSASFSFIVSDALSDVASIECSLDNAAFTPCTSPASASGLTAGSRNYRIRATDRAGNVSQPYTYTWSVDLTAPTVMITQMPTAVTALTNASFVFSGVGIITYECQLDTAAFSACTSPQAYNNLSMGAHTFRVRGTNAAGNVSAPAQFAWNIDNSAPTTPTIAANVSAVTRLQAASFNFTSVDANGILRYECSLDNVSFATCSNPHALTNVAAGAHTLRVRAVDNSNNTSGIGQFTWTVDITPPQYRPIVGNIPSGSFTQATSFTITALTAQDNVGIDRIECALVVRSGGAQAAFTNCVAPVVFNNLTEGYWSVVIRIYDLAGNMTPIGGAHYFTVDRTPPTIVMTTPPTNPSYVFRPTFLVTPQEQMRRYLCSIDNATEVPCLGTPSNPENYGTFPATLYVTDVLTEGPHTMRIRGEDLAGNLSAPLIHTWRITKDILSHHGHCGLTLDNKLRCGPFGADWNRDNFIQPQLNFSFMTSSQMGEGTTYLITTDGVMGRMHHPSSTTPFYPMDPNERYTKVVSADVFNHVNCGLTTSRKLKCWCESFCDTDFRTLFGVAPPAESYTPMTILPEVDFIDISSDKSDEFFAISAANELYSGNRSPGSTQGPSKVFRRGHRFQDVSAVPFTSAIPLDGSSSAQFNRFCGITTAQQLRCYGTATEILYNTTKTVYRLPASLTAPMNVKSLSVPLIRGQGMCVIDLQDHVHCLNIETGAFEAQMPELTFRSAVPKVTLIPGANGANPTVQSGFCGVTTTNRFRCAGYEAAVLEERGW